MLNSLHVQYMHEKGCQYFRIINPCINIFIIHDSKICSGCSSAISSKLMTISQRRRRDYAQQIRGNMPLSSPHPKLEQEIAAASHNHDHVDCQPHRRRDLDTWAHLPWLEADFASYLFCFAFPTDAPC